MKSCNRIKQKWISLSLVLVMCGSALTACGSSSAGETAFTAAQGPADAALPYQAVFAVDQDADERLIAAAQSFCSRMAEFSGGGAVFSLTLSRNALHDLKTGSADMILLVNPETDAFAPVTEAFRYKSYEQFAITVNADSTLRILSGLLDADVFAGFYAGSNVFLSRGTLDSKFSPLLRNKDSDDATYSQSVSVTALSNAAARAFSLLKAEVTVTESLEERILAASSPDSVVEFSHSELTSPAFLEALREDFAASAPANSTSGGGDSAESVDADPEPFVITQAYTEIKPVWLVFAASGYEKLSQTNRAAASEAAAYMVSDIDGAYLAHEREIMELLAAEEAVPSRDFAATRVQALRLADEQASKLTGTQRKLRDAVARIQ